MKTFEKVLEIFREYLDCDLEEEVLPCREGYLRVTCREVTEEDERQAEILCQSFRERWKEEEK